MQNTTRTDAEIERISRAFSSIEFVDRNDFEDFCFTELSKHARQLEQELNEARREADRQTEIANAMTEYMGDEAALIKERAQLRNVVDAACGFIYSILPEPPFDCRTEAEWGTAATLIAAHSQLPHVIERKTK